MSFSVDIPETNVNDDEQNPKIAMELFQLLSHDKLKSSNELRLSAPPDSFSTDELCITRNFQPNLSASDPILTKCWVATSNEPNQQFVIDYVKFSPNGRWIVSKNSGENADVIALWYLDPATAVLQRTFSVEKPSTDADLACCDRGHYIVIQNMAGLNFSVIATNDTLQSHIPNRLQSKIEGRGTFLSKNRFIHLTQTVLIFFSSEDWRQLYVIRFNDNVPKAIFSNVDSSNNDVWRWAWSTLTYTDSVIPMVQSDRTLRLWDAQHGYQLSSMDGQETIYQLAFSPNVRMVVTAKLDGLFVFEVESGILAGVYLKDTLKSFHCSMIRFVRFLDNTHILAHAIVTKSMGHTPRVAIWIVNIETSEHTTVMDITTPDALTYWTDGDTLLTVKDNKMEATSVKLNTSSRTVFRRLSDQYRADVSSLTSNIPESSKSKPRQYLVDAMETSFGRKLSVAKLDIIKEFFPWRRDDTEVTFYLLENDTNGDNLSEDYPTVAILTDDCVQIWSVVEGLCSTNVKLLFLWMPPYMQSSPGSKINNLGRIDDFAVYVSNEDQLGARYHMWIAFSYDDEKNTSHQVFIPMPFSQPTGFFGSVDESVDSLELLRQCLRTVSFFFDKKRDLKFSRNEPGSYIIKEVTSLFESLFSSLLKCSPTDRQEKRLSEIQTLFSLQPDCIAQLFDIGLDNIFDIMLLDLDSVDGSSVDGSSAYKPLIALSPSVNILRSAIKSAKAVHVERYVSMLLRNATAQFQVWKLSESKTSRISWMWIFVECLDELCRLYPKLVATSMNAIIYIPVWNPQSSNSQLLKPLKIREDGHVGGTKFVSEHTNLCTVLHIEQSRVSHSARHPIMQSKTWTNEQHGEMQTVELCVVPLPGFSTYSRCTCRHINGDGLACFWHTWMRPRSPFSVQALKRKSYIFDFNLMDIILEYKWKAFARSRYLAMLSVYLFFGAIFLGGIFAPPNSAIELTLASVALVLASMFLIQTCRQILGYPSSHLSFYTFVDLMAFSLSIATTVLTIKCAVTACSRDISQRAYPDSLASFAVYAVFWRFILQLRMDRKFGVFIAMLVNIGKKLSMVALMTFLILLATSLSLNILLRSEIAESPSEYTGLVGNQNVILNQSPTNYFATLDYSLRSVYFFLTGDYSATAYWDANRFVDVYRIVFTATTTLIILNVLIALMNDVVMETKEQSEKVWRRERAALIAEIEIYYMLPKERQNKNNFPHLVYYVASPDLVSAQHPYLPPIQESRTRQGRERTKKTAHSKTNDDNVNN